MMLNRTSGGLLTNGRTQGESPNKLPDVQPMRPPAAAQPQQQQPQRPAPQPPQPQQGLTQGGPQDQGYEQGYDQGYEEQGPMNNDLANNALALLHDEEFAPQAEQLIAQGEEGAAQLAVMVGRQVVDDHLQNGVQPDPAQASDAIMEVIGDIVDIGLATGAFPQEPLINGVPAAAYATMAYAADGWAAQFPEFGADLQNELAQATAEDDNAARQVAAYMKERKNAQQSQPTQEQPVGPNVGAGGSVTGSAQPY